MVTLPYIPTPFVPTLDTVVAARGQYGILGIEPRFYRATWDNTYVEDLTDYVLSGAVTHDTAREAGNWVLEATMTLDGWDRLRPFEDWIAPVLTVRYAGGVDISQQLGHYVVLDAPERHEELGGTVRLDARDALWVLWSSGLRLENVGLPQGGRLLKTRQVIEGALVPGPPETARLRHTITVPPDENTAEWLGPWKEDDRRIQLVNRMLAAGAWFPLFSGPTGILGIKKRALLQQQNPLRSWYANGPNDVVAIAGESVDLRPFYGVPSVVVGGIDTSPASARIIDEVVVKGELGPSGAVTATPTVGGARVSGSGGYDPAGSDPTRGGARTRTVSLGAVADTETAQTLAQSLIEEWLTENTTVALTVLPDPRFIAIHDIVRCGIWNAQGHKVAVGKYLVKRVRYGMTPEDALMRVDLGSIEDLAPEVF